MDAIRQGHERSATAQAHSELYLGPGHDYYFISGPSSGCEMFLPLWLEDADILVTSALSVVPPALPVGTIKLS